MFSLAFRRIMWKEWREQTALWIALFLGALLLQVLAVVFNQSTTGSQIATVVVVLTACFVVASLSLLFAGETENGTRDWLRQLPIRTSVLLSAKLVFAVLATLLFLTASSVSAYLAILLRGRTVAEVFSADVLTLSQSIFGLFAWGLFFSQRCRKVLHAILAAVAAELVVMQLSDHLIGELAAQHWMSRAMGDAAQSLSFFAITGIVLLVALVTSRRWAQTGVSSLTTAVAPNRRRALQTPLADLLHPAWLSLVKRAARCGSPVSRETAVLVWREARSAAPFIAIWSVVGFLMVDLFSFLGNVQAGGIMPLQPLFLLGTPALCGLLTCLHDQRDQSFLFLAERGVSPARVWWTKQGVWAAVTMLLVLAFLRWRYTAPQLAMVEQPPVSVLARALAAIHVPRLTPFAPDGGVQDAALRWHFLWSLGAALFAAGQCASFWIRRGVLALAATLISVPILLLWHVVLVQFDVPLSIGSWPLTFALMAATLVSAGVWLRGRDSWKLRSVRLAAIVLPVCAVVTAAAAYRAWSVPEFNFLATNDMWEVTARESAYDPAWSNRWRAVLTNFRTSPLAGRYSTIGFDKQSEVRNELIELGEQLAHRSSPIDPLVLSPDDPYSVIAIATFLANPPLHLPQAENAAVAAAMASQGALVTETPVTETPPPQPIQESVDNEWRALAAGLRIARLLSQECLTSEQFLDCVGAREPLLTAVQAWSQRPDQTPAALTTAFDFLTSDLKAPISARQMFINRYVFYSQLLEHRGRKWQQLESDAPYLRGGGDRVASVATLPWYERERGQRVLGQITQELLTHGFEWVDSPAPHVVQLRRWALMNAGLPLDVQELLSSDDPAYSQQTAIGALKMAGVREAATALLVALQRYQLEHNERPLSLVGLVPPDVAPLMMDDYAQAPFGYEPQGLPGDLYLPGGRVVPAGQPLLWSAGIHGNRISQAMESIHFGRGETLEVPRGAFYLAGLRYSPAAENLTVVVPTPILFLEETFQNW